MRYTMTVRQLKEELDKLCQEGKSNYRVTFRVDKSGPKYQAVAVVETVNGENLVYMQSGEE